MVQQDVTHIGHFQSLKYQMLTAKPKKDDLKLLATTLWKLNNTELFDTFL